MGVILFHLLHFAFVGQFFWFQGGQLQFVFYAGKSWQMFHFGTFSITFVYWFQWILPGRSPHLFTPAKSQSIPIYPVFLKKIMNLFPPPRLVKHIIKQLCFGKKSNFSPPENTTSKIRGDSWATSPKRSPRWISWLGTHCFGASAMLGSRSRSRSWFGCNQEGLLGDFLGKDGNR